MVGVLQRVSKLTGRGNFGIDGNGAGIVDRPLAVDFRNFEHPSDFPRLCEFHAPASQGLFHGRIALRLRNESEVVGGKGRAEGG